MRWVISFMASMLLLKAAAIPQNRPHHAIPSREEQANLLKVVDDIFDEMYTLVVDEAIQTDKSVVEDTNKVVNRARDQLDLIKEVSVLKLSCDNNNVCMMNARPIVEDTIKQGQDGLNQCTFTVSNDIQISSSTSANVTNASTVSGREFVNKLKNCSQKKGLGIISCYRHIIETDVPPLKVLMLDAIGQHKKAHSRAINIRNKANDCVDSMVMTYQNKVAQIMENAAKCQ